MEKENMKKVLTIVIGLVLTLTLLTGVGTAVPLTTNGATGTTQVTFGISDGYTITIPDLIQLQLDANTAHGLNVISGQITRLSPNSYLNVTISASEDYYDSEEDVWLMVNNADESSNVSYFVNSGTHVPDDAPASPIVYGDVVFSLNNIGGSALLSGSKEIHCKIMDVSSISDSGSYVGELTFTVNVVSVPSSE